MFVGVLLSVLGAIALALAICAVIFFYDYLRFKIGIYALTSDAPSGFAAKHSHARGEPVALSVNARRPLALRIYRLAEAWTPLERTIDIPAHHQPLRFDRRCGVAWDKTISIETGDLAPGLYRFHLFAKDDARVCFDIPVIIRDDQPKPLRVILGTNTWQAYNPFGGISHYENHHASKLSKAIGAFVRRPKWCPDFVPTRRPNALFSDEANMSAFGEDYSSFVVRNELEFLMFLERNGYSFSVYCDEDLDKDPGLLGANALVFPGHCEYWTDNMYYALERYIEIGGKVYFSNSELAGHCAYTADGLAFFERLPDGNSNMIAGSHATLDGAFTAAPYRVVDGAHWIFAGIDLKAGDLFGADCANHPSFDAVGHQHLRSEIDLTGQPLLGASGFFTSKVGYGSGAFKIIAEGTNPRGPAHMVCRDLPSGGWVFSASSHCFNGSLARDPVVAQIVRNLMSNAATGPQAPSGSR